jgi:hypothetical protein
MDLSKSVLTGATAAAVTFLALEWYRSRRAGAAASSSGKGEAEDISTTSSSHSGNVYETQKAVAEYLMFHFGEPKDLLPYADGPTNALDFAAR